MRRFLPIVLIIFLVAIVSCEKKKPAKIMGKLPAFSLEDPLGKMHTSKEVVKNGLVLVVTAPTLHNSGAQNNWSTFLLETMPNHNLTLVFLEDMDPSSFKGTALKEMKKDFKENEPPLLLIDNTGNLRKKLGVEKNETWVLVYNKDAELLFTEKSKPTKALAQTIWGKLKK